MRATQCFKNVFDKLLPRDDMVFPDVIYRYSDGEKPGHVYVNPFDTVLSLDLPDDVQLVVEDAMVVDGMIIWKDELEDQLRREGFDFEDS
jgi:hypothetical protein